MRRSRLNVVGVVESLTRMKGGERGELPATLSSLSRNPVSFYTHLAVSQAMSEGNS